MYSGRITKVKFSLTGSESVRKDSYAQISSHDLFRNNLPYPGGVYDAHTGTTDHSYRCQTCYNNKRNCLGHPGHIHLNYPVWSGIALAEGRKWLKLICFNCGKPIIAESHFAHISRSKRLEEAAKMSHGTANKKCIHCKTVHPIIKKSTTEPLAIVAEIYEDKRQIDKWTILPHAAGQVFNRISDATVVALGKKLNSHPRNIILWDIQAPPVTIRPDVKKIGGGRSANNDLTTMLQILVKKNDVMPSVVPENIDSKLEKAIFELNNAYYDFVRSSGEGSNSIASRLKGKQGRGRKNQMGKRVRVMCRSTIVGSSRIKIDEVGVPLVFARIVQVEETVQEFNKKRLLEYVQNGTKRYPGATKVIKKSTGAECSVDSAQDIELENGDIVLRDIVDGDAVNFGRQPSLTISNVATHYVKVIPDPTVKALLMNVIACKWYNADFDGDAMILVVSANLATRNEIRELSSVSNWLISHMNASPTVGQVDDSIIGSAELTRTNVKFDKYHALLLFQTTTKLPLFTEGGLLSGRDCISKILADTPINFTRMTEWYKPNMAAHIKYDPDDIRVKIDQGRLVSGILDKKSIGAGSNGGVYHLIANEYGPDKSLGVMFDMQQMAISYILQFGYTIGIMDFIVSQESKLEIDGISADIINKSRLITEELQNGEIIPPIGKTIEGFFEERQINTLSIFDDFTEPILKAINHSSNNLFKLIMVGSKGKLDNMFNMVSAIGQKLINGERIRQKFGFKRTLAYFPRFDTSPQARGFITNSYLSGMDSAEYTFNAMAARFDLITKALTTSVTGEQNRKSIKNLESIITDFYRRSCKNLNIIQFAYGEDFLDPRKVERVKFPTVICSVAVFKDKFSHDKFPDFFAQMGKDREDYRRLFFKVEHMNVKELISDERRMPVDVERVASDILHANRAILKEPDEATLAAMVAQVDNFCAVLPYVLINEIQEKRKSAVPEVIQAASWLMTMLVRSTLHPKALSDRKVTKDILGIILDKIKLKYSQALVEPGTAVGIIAAQSFSEPLTQYVLDAHHRSASGGTSKSGVTNTKEVLGAKDVSKLVGPEMLIPVLPEFASNKAKVQEIANNIEVIKFSQFVVVWQVFFEQYGNPKHSKFVGEKDLISEFNKLNPLLQVPGNLVKWCIRFVLNKSTLILKNMSLELIITRLRDTFPDMYIVYSPENSPQIILRCYMRANMFKNAVKTSDILGWKTTILGTIIRGIDGIINTTVIKMIRNKIDADGSIQRNDNIWGISTNGTNMRGVFTSKFVDKLKVHTSAIQEIYKMLGVEAARQKIISELRNIIEACNLRHYTIYADEMCYTGRVTSIESSGLKTRETSNVLLRIGFSSPIGTIEEAAVNSMEDTVTGITAPLLVGSIPRHGTLYSSFHVNRDFVQEHVKKPDDLVDELLG